jgi:hypothetical protein
MNSYRKSALFSSIVARVLSRQTGLALLGTVIFSVATLPAPNAQPGQPGQSGLQPPGQSPAQTLAPSQPPTPGSTQIASGDQPQSLADSAPSGANGETYWRNRTGAIKAEIAENDQQIEKVKAEIAKQRAASFDPSTGVSQNVIIVHDRNQDVRDLEQRKQSLQRELDGLADEARKAGVDSGWVH